MQVQNAERNLQQIILIHLEEFIARKILDRISQFLGRVRTRCLARALQDTAHLAPDQRHRTRALVIGLCREQADKTCLSDNGAVLAIPFDADIIHVDAAMDVRLHIGLGHDERGGFTQEGFNGRGQNGRFGTLAEHMAIRVTQHTAAGFRPHARMALSHRAVFIHLEIIDTATEEGEMVVAQPAQEFHRLRQFIRRCVGPCARQMRNGIIHLGPHVGPVLNRDTDIIQGRGDALDQCAAGQFIQRRQMNLDHRLGETPPAFRHARSGIVPANLNNRVEHGRDIVALGPDFAHNRVDDEWPVPTDDLQDVTRQVGAIRVGRGSHAHEDIIARARLPELPEVEAERGKV